MAEQHWWTELGRFWERSTGGRDVAANLISTGHSAWPTAPRGAGIDVATEWLRSGLGASSLPRLVYLVGGPGAGKSHAAASVVAGLVPMDPPSELAARKYEYQHPLGGAELIVVNDATISSGEFQHAPLSAETNEAIRKAKSLLGCVNRGILVEEAASLRRAGASAGDDAGTTIVDWLQGSGRPETERSKHGWAVESTAGEVAFFRAGTLYEGDVERAHLVAVYVDVNSLFENAPTVLLDAQVDLEISSTEYRVADFAERMVPGKDGSPASVLLDEVARVLSPVETPELVDPFYANAESLKVESVRRGVASMLRAAEIVSSQRMTYREVWGALSRCVIGGAHMHCNADQLQQFVVENQPTNSDGIELTFAKTRFLAEFRFSQSLFGSTEALSELQRDPVLRLTYLVDPVRDAIPGYVEDKLDLGWATAIADAFSGDLGTSSPLETLLTAGNQSSMFEAVVTDFDRKLDLAFVRFVQRAAERERQDASAWYGAYLLRLYAVANGLPAFRREVTVWTAAWRLSSNLPQELEQQLTTLLKPLRYPEKGGGIPLYPIFESRTNPIRGDQPIMKLAIRAEVGKITSATDSDSLFVAVNAPGMEPTRMLLDFAMVREAMACSHGHVGATELSDTTSPRLERFRAARLVPGKKADVSDYRIVLPSGDTAVSVEVGS